MLNIYFLFNLMYVLSLLSFLFYTHKSTKKTYLTNLSPLASTFKSITPASYAIIFIETNMYTF